MKKLKACLRFSILLCILLPAAAAPGQNYEPALEYASLLNMRFYPQTGGFLVDDLQIVFPPQTNQPMELVISKAGGEAVVTLPLRMEQWGKYPAFDGLAPNGQPGSILVGQAGDFEIALEVGGRKVTTMNFSLKAEGSDDPFNPKKYFTREGPWRALGYLSLEVDKPDSPLHFNWWTSERELPAGMNRPRGTVHVLRGGREIAASASPIIISNEDWQFCTNRLVQPKSEGGQNLTLAALTKQDGDLKIVFKADGKPIKTYTAQVVGGELQRLARCRLDTSPHTDFISPRLIDTSSGTGSRYRMLDAYWVEASGK